MIGSPTTFFDGGNVMSGGCGGDCLPPYTDNANAALAIKSPILINIESIQEQNNPGIFYVAVDVDKYETVTNNNLRLALVLTESNIDYPWGGRPTLEFLDRRIYPDENGYIIDLKNNSSVHKTYSVDATNYAKENCHLIAFVFDYDTRKVYQTQEVVLDNGITSVNKNKLDNFNIYPNPSKDIININISNNNETYTIKNLLGVTVLEGELTEGNNTVDVSSLNNGNYIIIVNNYIKKITILK